MDVAKSVLYPSLIPVFSLVTHYYLNKNNVDIIHVHQWFFYVRKYLVTSYIMELLEKN